MARALLQDASVSLLTRDETGEVTHATRAISRGLRRRLEHRYPVCANCGGDGPFDIDHIVPIEHGGETSDENTWRLCRHCHRLKTYFGWNVERDDHDRRRLVPARGGGP